jgi:hypothetical protein
MNEWIASFIPLHCMTAKRKFQLEISTIMLWSNDPVFSSQKCIWDKSARMGKIPNPDTFSDASASHTVP